MASISEAKKLPARPYSHAARWSIDSWAWEILSCSLSIIATIIVAVLVFIYDDKSLPTLPYQIGLNSVIAIIGTVSKSALLLTITSCISQYKWVIFDDTFENNSLQDLQLHDEASRGPWGSFMLLVNWKGLYWVKLGALITVLSLAFDPVYQALIKIEQRSKYQNHPVAIVKRALSFEDSSNYLTGGSIGYFSNDWYSGISSAILSNTSALETNPSCPTGNCTFPVFSSLAFCSNCIDITKSLEQNSICAQTKTYDSAHNIDGSEKRLITYLVDCTYWLPLSSSGLNYSYHEAEYWTLHKGSDISQGWPLTEDEDHKFYEIMAAPAFIAKFLLENSTLSGPNEIRLSDGEIIPSSFATIALIKLAPRSGSMSRSFLDTANICALSVCAKEYNISMTSGLLQSNIISTSYSKLTRYNDPNMPYIGNSSYTFVFPNNVNNFTFVAKKIDEVRYFEDKMWDVLREILERQLYLDSDSSWNLLDLRAPQGMFETALNASTDISKTMDRVAEAMTNRLRDINNHTIQGQSGSMELYIRASWWWFLLPVFCVIFETIFLISVMIATRKHKLSIWKASELALLFHGLGFSIGDTVETQKASEMENIASALQVRLGRGSKGILKLERKLE